MVKSWLVQDQTVLGKDYSNLLIADSLLKTIWFINAPCYGNEALASPKANELAIPEQTATGKGKTNPFMAGVTEESWALLEDLALYDNESWNDPRDFAKPVKAISLPQDVPSTSDRRLIELENQVQRLMEAHLAMMQPTQVNKITSSCEICSGPHDTQYCMENPKQAFVEYASSRTDEAEDGLIDSQQVVSGQVALDI
ncbi:hypothetical protein Tco_0942615 [Tanacetum coccineum]